MQKQILSKDLLEPMVLGQIISLDDWVPERPPKNPLLRIPSPELPPPPPPPTSSIVENDLITISQDEPLPPPPPELLRHMRQLSEPETKPNPTSRRNSFAGSTTKKPILRASTFDNLLPENMEQAQPHPPVVPKKTHPMEVELKQRSISSLGKLVTSHPVIHNSHHNEARISIRKRSHNAQLTPIEIDSQQQQRNTTKGPPPLKPRNHDLLQQQSNDNRGISSMTSRIR